MSLEVNASSGEIADIKAAINQLGTNDGTVIVPNDQVDLLMDFNDIGVNNRPKILQVRGGISLKFQGTHYTLRNVNTEGISSTIFLAEGSNNKPVTFTGDYTLELQEDLITEDWTDYGQSISGIGVYGVRDYVVTGGKFRNFPSTAVYVSNNGVHNPTGNLGVIHHNDFDNPYKDNYFQRTGKYAIGGYGIIVGGEYSTNEADWVPWGDLFGKYRPNTAFIEDNTFHRCRHCVAESDECGFYVFRHNYLTEMINAQLGSYIDVHPGGRGAEIYANTILNSPTDARSNPAYVGYYGVGVTNYGGSCLNYGNTFQNFPQSPIAQLANTVTSIPSFKRVNGVWMWGNNYVNAGAEEVRAVSGDPPWTITENVEYFRRAPTLASDGFTYTPYKYPHPLAETTPPPPNWMPWIIGLLGLWTVAYFGMKKR